jgi:hypothetical protein
LIHDETDAYWSGASGNEEALNECYRFCTSAESSECEGVGKGAAEALREVMLVVGSPGCGATALANQLALRLRAVDQNVLAIDEISSFEPGNFKASLDVALRIPPLVDAKTGSATVGLNALQLAVLEARSYECFIVHDADIYGFDESAQAGNAAVILQLLRINQPARIVIFGVANSVEWLKIVLKDASLGCRTIQLEPMQSYSEFGRFIIDVALHVLPPCPPRRVEGLGLDSIYDWSGGCIGLAVTALIHKIMEEIPLNVVDDEQSIPMFSCVEDESTNLEISHGAGGQTIPSETFEAEALQAAVVVERCAADDSVGRSRRDVGSGCSTTQALALWHSKPPETELRHHHPVVDNESFSSWVARQAMGLSHSTGYTLASHLVSYCSRGGSDPDMQWGNLEILQHVSLADRLYISAKFTLPRRSSSYRDGSANPSGCESPKKNGGLSNLSAGMTPYYEALNYCPKCFKSDLAVGLAPALRLDWRKPRMSVCLRHNTPVLLERLATSNFTLLDKAWTAFAEYAGSPASRLTTQFPLQCSSSNQAKVNNERLVALAARMQTWFFALTTESMPSANAAEFLMFYWLQDGNENGAQGFARSYFFSRTINPLWKKTIKHGEILSHFKTDSARPRDVAVAYWMLGVGFGVISTSEAEFIRDIAKGYSIPFPTSQGDVSSAGTLVYSPGQRQVYLTLAKSTLSDSEYDSVEWALK